MASQCFLAGGLIACSFSGDGQRTRYPATLRWRCRSLVSISYRSDRVCDAGLHCCEVSTRAFSNIAARSSRQSRLRVTFVTAHCGATLQRRPLFLHFRLPRPLCPGVAEPRGKAKPRFICRAVLYICMCGGRSLFGPSSRLEKSSQLPRRLELRRELRVHNLPHHRKTGRRESERGKRRRDGPCGSGGRRDTALAARLSGGSLRRRDRRNSRLEPQLRERRRRLEEPGRRDSPAQEIGARVSPKVRI